MPEFEFEADYLTLHVLPMFSVTALQCANEECAECHGTGILVGWLFWNLRVSFHDSE